MKLPLFLVAALVLSPIVIPVQAGLSSSPETEFLRLREKRDQALAAAAGPINESYRADLEKLLARAVADQNKDTAAKIRFELQSIGAAGVSPPLPAPAAPQTPEMAALQKALSDTKWRRNHDQTFLLNADGTSVSNWTQRKGHWKVLDGTTVELDIGNIPRLEKVTLDQGVTLMTWVDREVDEVHARVAKKIVPVADK